MEKNSQGLEQRPKVGIGVLIFNDKNEVLLGLRQNAHGAGEWHAPGGHVEFGETIFETAKREAKEEADLDIDQCELISVADEMRYIKTHGKHYVNLGILAKYIGGKPRAMEPEKCREWQWFLLDNLPEPLYEGTQLTIKNYKDKKIYQPNT